MAERRRRKKREAVDLDERERAVLIEAIKRKRDPVLSFVPNGIQKEWRECDAHFTMINGANQIGGKTYGICITIAELLRGIHRMKFENAKFLVLTPSRGQAADPFGKYLLERASCPGPAGENPMLNPDDVRVTVDRSTAPPAVKHIKHIGTGNEVFFFWSAFHAAQNFLEGKQFSWIFIDESAGTKALIEELMPRTAFARLQNPMAGRITWTATETKVNEAHTDFQLKCEEPSLEDYKLFTVTDAVLDQGSVFDRKTIEAVYSGSDETQKNIRMRGNEGAGQNVLIYPVLSTNHDAFVLEEPYEPSEYDNIVVAFDPGMGHPGALMFAFYNENEPMKAYIKQFFCSSGVMLPEWVEILRRYLDGRRLSAFVPDKYGAGHRDRGTGKSTMQQMAELMDDESLWVDGRVAIRTVKQEHKMSIARLGSYFITTGDRANPKPLMVFDPPDSSNGIRDCFRQIAGYRGRPDLNFKGPHGVVKKNDEGPDCARLLAQLGWKWKDNGVNRRRGIYSPESYIGDMVMAGPPELSEEDKAKAKRRESSRKIAERLRRKRMRRSRGMRHNMF